MVMLKDENSFNVDGFVTDFKASYGQNIERPTGDNGSFVFTVDGETAAIAHMNVPIPAEDIEDTAQYAYNWLTTLNDTKDHKSHLIVSLMHGGQDQVKRFKIFTQIICSLLRTTDAVGVYKGYRFRNRKLLLRAIADVGALCFITAIVYYQILLGSGSVVQHKVVCAEDCKARFLRLNNLYRLLLSHKLQPTITCLRSCGNL